MAQDAINPEDAAELLRNSQITGSDDQIARVAARCIYRRDLLNHAAVILRATGGGDASRFDDDDVQIAFIQGLKKPRESDYHKLAFYYGQSDDWYALERGSYHTVGLRKGAFRDGLKLAEWYQQANVAEDHAVRTLLHDEGLYALALGDLERAEQKLREAADTLPTKHAEYYGTAMRAIYAYVAQQNLVDIHILKGELLPAEHVMDRMVQEYEFRDVTFDWRSDDNAYSAYHYLRVAISARGEATGSNPFARRAHIRALRGDVDAALRDFKSAEHFQHDMSYHYYQRTKPYLDAYAYYRDDQQRVSDAFMLQMTNRDIVMPPLIGQAALHYADLLTRLGKLNTALPIVDYNYRWAKHHLFRSMAARAAISLSDLHRLMHNPDLAHEVLEHPLSWVAESEHQEIYQLARLSKARAYLAQYRHDAAYNLAELVSTEAASLGFRLIQIDALITQGNAAWQAGDVENAYHIGESALNLAFPLNCGYRWAHAAALHLMGIAHLARTEDDPNDHEPRQDKAYRLLHAAAQIRDRIHDPRFANTIEPLSHLMPPQERY